MSSRRLQYGTKRDVGPILQWIRDKLRGVSDSLVKYI